MTDEKKIIIDEDWKKQAQQEKETLKEKEQAEKEQKAAETTEDAEGGERGPLPEPSLGSLIQMLTTQALFAMGVLKVQGQEEQPMDLALAKYHIDMLGVLEAKTKGNLTEDETAALSNTLNELRMGFVQIANQGPPQAE